MHAAREYVLDNPFQRGDVESRFGMVGQEKRCDQGGDQTA
jgi:hypothetical protein